MITIKEVILLLVLLSTIRKLYQYYFYKKYDKRFKTNCIWLSEYLHICPQSLVNNPTQSPKSADRLRERNTKMSRKCAALQWPHYNYFIKCCYLLIALPGIFEYRSIRILVAWFHLLLLFRMFALHKSFSFAHQHHL